MILIDAQFLPRLAASAMLALLIAGCGVRGPLEAPRAGDQPAQPAQATTPETPEERARRAAEPLPPGVYWTPQATGTAAFPDRASGIEGRRSNAPAAPPRPAPTGTLFERTILDPLL